MIRMLLLILVIEGLQGAGGGGFEANIIGGHEAVPHSQPYMASLQKKGIHFCGGVLVDKQWVLTAAHCVPRGQEKFQVVLGLHQLQRPGFSFQIKRVVIHPAYEKPPVLKNDLALLQLNTKVTKSFKVRPIHLPRGWSPKPVQGGTKCTVAGWGLLHQDGKLAKSLQELTVEVLFSQTCNNSRFWNGGITAKMLCVRGTKMGSAPCKGDSGGPLVCKKGEVDGIISFGYSEDCTDVFHPPVVTAVAPYRSWIKKILR